MNNPVGGGETSLRNEHCRLLIILTSFCGDNEFFDRKSPFGWSIKVSLADPWKWKAGLSVPSKISYLEKGERSGTNKKCWYNIREIWHHKCTGWMGWMSHRKWKENKQQPSMLPGPPVPGYSLISFYFLWASGRPIIGQTDYRPYRHCRSPKTDITSWLSAIDR